MVKVPFIAGVVVTASHLAYSQLIYSPNNVSDTVNGIKVLQGNRGDLPYITPAQAFSQMSLFSNDDFENKIKSGQLQSITFTQHDADLLASTTSYGKWDLYETLPVSSNITLPPIIPDITNEVSTTGCCTPNGLDKDKVDLQHSKVSTNVTKRFFVNLLHGLNLDATAPDNFSHPSSETNHDLARRQAGGAPTVYNIPLGTKVPLIPTLDFFYHQVPMTYVFAKLGAPIAFRAIGINLEYYGKDTQGFQFSYRSENSGGFANLDTATVLIPADNDHTHFVSFQNHEDGRSINCHESYSLATGASDPDVVLFLRNQWPVLVPDYLGPSAVFGANLRGARSVLNSMRAFIQLNTLFKANNTQAFMFGYSAGATITGKAGEIVSSYAPELVGNIKAMSIGGYVVNMIEGFHSVNKGRYAGFVPMQLSALANEYPQFGSMMYSHINMTEAWKFYATRTCAPVLVFFVGQDMNYLTTYGTKFIEQPYIRDIMNQNSAGQNGIPFPVYIFQSDADLSANVNVVDAAVTKYCQSGTRVSYLRDSNGNGHLAEESLRTGTSVPFFKQIIAGNLPHTCTDFQSARIAEAY